MRTHRYAVGTRVRLRRGAFPMDPRLPGREGMIVEMSDYRQGKYGIQLDDEETVRAFAEDELEPLAPDPKPESDLGSAGPTIKG